MIQPFNNRPARKTPARHPEWLNGHHQEPWPGPRLVPRQQPVKPPSWFRFKYPAERLTAALLVIPATPLIFILCCLVRITSRGRALYRQDRVGLDGAVFSMLKIRTMNVDAESSGGPQWCVRDDPRITGFGKFLRLLHLDELPQLFNVIKGEMSLVGPRPERPDFVKVLSEQVPGYCDRLLVKPGITGLAQIYLPPDETIDCVRKKVCFDRAYVETASVFVDLQIWACTLVRVFGLRGGKGPQWFGLDRRYRDVARKCLAEGNQHQPTNGNANGEISQTAPPLNGQSRQDSAESPLNGFSDRKRMFRRPDQPR